MATAVVTSAMLRTWPVRFEAMELTVSVRSFQVPATPLHLGLAAQLAFGADLAGHARDLRGENERSWSTIVLMVSLSCRISPRTSTVIFLERSPLATAVVTSAMLRTWPVRFAGHRVDAVGEVLPGPGHALDLGLAAELALGADLAGDAGDLGGEGAELLDHGVDGAAVRRNSPFSGAPLDLQGHGLAQVALGDRADDPGDLVGGAGQVGDQVVDARRRASRQPPAAAASEAALRGLAFLADGLADPLQLAPRAALQLDDVVERVGDLARRCPVLSTGRRTVKSPFLTATRMLSSCFGSRASMMASGMTPSPCL